METWHVAVSNLTMTNLRKEVQNKTAMDLTVASMQMLVLEITMTTITNMLFLFVTVLDEVVLSNAMTIIYTLVLLIAMPSLDLVVRRIRAMGSVLNMTVLRRKLLDITIGTPEVPVLSCIMVALGTPALVITVRGLRLVLQDIHIVALGIRLQNITMVALEMALQFILLIALGVAHLVALGMLL